MMKFETKRKKRTSSSSPHQSKYYYYTYPLLPSSRRHCDHHSHQLLPLLLFPIRIALFLLLLTASSAPHLVVNAKKSLPKSKQSIFLTSHHPPAWNHSPQIDSQGFLSCPYKLHPGSWEHSARIGGKYGPNSPLTRQLKKKTVTIRQVPGDGNCLFHSLSTALCWVEEGVHLDYDQGYQSSTRMRKGKRHCNKYGEEGRECPLLELKDRSKILRQIAVDVLDPSKTVHDAEKKHGPLQIIQRRLRHQRDRLLFLQGSEYLRQGELLNVACSQYEITGEEYCESMKKDGVWGGGPEIVALCNYLKRPIHVYELMTWYPKTKATKSRGQKQTTSNTTRIRENPSMVKRECDDGSDVVAEFRLRRMACFGSPKFDYREPICILSADCRFPDLKPGQQASAGNHFMAILPPLNSGRMISRSFGRQRDGRMGDNVYHSGMRVRSGGLMMPLGKRRNVGRMKRSQSTFEKREVVEKYVRPLYATKVGGDDKNAASHSMESILRKSLEPVKRILTHKLSLLQ